MVQHSASGAGYGVSVSRADRDRFFRREWRTVGLRIANGKYRQGVLLGWLVHASHQRGDRTLDDQQWAGAWPRGQPPRFDLIPEGIGAFQLRAPADAA